MEEPFLEFLGYLEIHIRRKIQRHQSIRYLRFTSPYGHDLCSRCSKLDFDSIFSKTHYERFVARGLALPRPDETNPACCVLCNLLGQVNSWESGALYELRSFANMETYSSYCRPENEKAPVMLGSLSHQNVHEQCWYAGASYRLYRCSGYLCPIVDRPLTEGPSVGSPCLNPGQIDFRVPRKWIEYCRAHHLKSCELPSRRVISLKVIDCETRNITPADTSCEYIALSYVWGPPMPKSAKFEDEMSTTVAVNLPPTVSDAISVTRQLGFRYLWVDRYCIDQGNAEDKRVQIGQMDAIYQGAVATIVAAVGNTPTVGLPGSGTGNASRTPQLYAEVGRHRLVSTYKDPQQLIKKSTWMERGWTLQEAVLSRRLLIFTEEQLYFECAGMQCCEAVDYTMSPSQPTPLFSFHDHWSLFERLEEYSARKLSYDSDALNGFLGILRMYQDRSQPVYHLLGNPIPSVPLFRESQNEFAGQVASLSEAFAMGMFWTVKSPSKRRTNFPTWTWAGWAGEIYHWIARRTYKDANITKYIDSGWDVEVEVEQKDRTITTIDEFHESGGLAQQQSLYSYIRITSNTIPLTIVPFRSFMPAYFRRTTQLDPFPYIFTVRFSIPDTQTPYKYAYIPLVLMNSDVTGKSDMSNCLGILCQSKKGSFSVGVSTYPVIVVRQNGAHFERTGSFIPQEVSVFSFRNEKDEEVGIDPNHFRLNAVNGEFETTTKSELRTIRLG